MQKHHPKFVPAPMVRKPDGSWMPIHIEEPKGWITGASGFRTVFLFGSISNGLAGIFFLACKYGII